MSPKLLSTAAKLRLELQQKQAKSSASANGGSKSVSRTFTKKKPASQPHQGNGTKKRKRSSPFRIKSGCVVALRHSNEVNSVSLLRPNESPKTVFPDDLFVQLWTRPLPVRDEGLALIGKRVRCFFPKEGQKRRVLEGEIVGLVGYGLRRKRATPIRVELLVDKDQLDHFAFLPRTDEEVDVSKLASAKAIRNHRLEERIRGKNKATVKVKLANPLRMDTTNGIRWAIQKTVPSKLFHKPMKRNIAGKAKIENGILLTEKGEQGDHALDRKLDAAGTAKHADANGGSSAEASEPTKKKRKAAATTGPRHLGDGNDSAEQQVTNWRWLASRYHDMLLSANRDSVDPYGAEILSNGFVGEVVKVDSSSPLETGSLATVTLRRLILPEHTRTGRLQHHGPFDIFEEKDNSKANGAGSQATEILLQAPVEQVVIVSQKIQKASGSATNEEPSLDQLSLSHAYSLRDDTYSPLVCALGGETEDSGDQQRVHMNKCCHRCRRNVPDQDAVICTLEDCPLMRPGSNSFTTWCTSCLEAVGSGNRQQNVDENERELPCCRGLCDCRDCLFFTGSNLHEDLRSTIADAIDTEVQGMDSDSVSNVLAVASCATKAVSSIDFGLPHDFLDANAVPIAWAKPTTKVKARTAKKSRRVSLSNSGRPVQKKLNDKKNVDKASGKTSESDRASEQDRGHGVLPKEDYSIFKPTCARMIQYDTSKKRQSPTLDFSASENADKPRNLREVNLDTIKDGEKDEKTTSSRAARANQRRFMKDVTAIGAVSLGLDKLATREPMLRFDRSGIHAWGVFADEDITADEMIIEYRGELIGNAVAEMREREYERAKIGSDFMFRIDSSLVCDATKQGNVARFINASCDPNCYTKIITLDGNKRIVIYAKRDIRTGEELCYDYKFPLEYDESKRIPCHCGARDCRGFMNWVCIYLC